MQSKRQDSNNDINAFSLVLNIGSPYKYEIPIHYTVQSRFSDIKFSDNLWFSDYFTKTVFQFTT